MKTTSKRATTARPAHPDLRLLNEPEGAFELRVGLTKFAELQRTDPRFPKPLWLGPRCKRHDREALREYARSLAGRKPA